MKTSSVIEKSTVNLNISFSNVATGLYDISLICINYTDNNSVAIDLSSNNSSYKYISGILKSDKSEIYKFLDKVSIKSIEGWNYKSLYYKLLSL